MTPLRPLCRALCRYYKPGRTEESTCGGLAWVEARLPQEAVAVLLGSLDPGTDPLFGVSPEDPRLLAICGRCEYRVDGCDFRDPAVPREECAPCGGVRAAAALLSSGRAD